MLQDKIKKCLHEGKQKGERHQGLRKVKSDSKESDAHLAKALHNFEAMTRFREIGYSDWSASAAFYTLYHGLLAILSRRGYESRNQSCTFAVLEDLVDKGIIKELAKSDLKEIFDKDITTDLAHSTKILDIRERLQYSTKTSLEDKEFQLLKRRTQDLLKKIRLEIERTIE